MATKAYEKRTADLNKRMQANWITTRDRVVAEALTIRPDWDKAALERFCSEDGCSKLWDIVNAAKEVAKATLLFHAVPVVGCDGCGRGEAKIGERCNHCNDLIECDPR